MKNKCLSLMLLFAVVISSVTANQSVSVASSRTPKMSYAFIDYVKSEIKVKFSKVSEAKKYQIYGFYHGRVDSGWMEIESTKLTNFRKKIFIPAPVGNYSKLKVRAVMENGKVGKFSKPIKCKTVNLPKTKTKYFNTILMGMKDKGYAYKVTVNGNKFNVYGSMYTSKSKFGGTSSKAGRIKKHSFQITKNTKFVNYKKNEFIKIVKSMNGLQLSLKVYGGKILKAELIS